MPEGVTFALRALRFPVVTDLVNTQTSDALSNPITVVLNWKAEVSVAVGFLVMGFVSMPLATAFVLGAIKLGVVVATLRPFTPKKFSRGPRYRDHPRCGACSDYHALLTLILSLGLGDFSMPANKRKSKRLSETITVLGKNLSLSHMCSSFRGHRGRIARRSHLVHDGAPLASRGSITPLFESRGRPQRRKTGNSDRMHFGDLTGPREDCYKQTWPAVLRPVNECNRGIYRQQSPKTQAPR